MVTPVSRRMFLASGLAGAGMSLAPVETRGSGAGLAVDRLVRDYCAAHHIPACGLVATVAGKPVVKASLGLASLAFDVPAGPSTLFQIGSVGKHVTAAAILRLADRGRLGLDDALAAHLPDVDAQWGRRTIRQLLLHTAGTPDYFEAGLAMDRPFTRDDLMGFTQRFPPFAPGGQTWHYCNAAYTLLGVVIEAATGQSYGDHVTALFRAHGLTDSRADDGEAVIKGRAEPVVWTGVAYRRPPQSSSSVSAVAAGGLLMSLRDAPAWIGALDGATLLSADARRAMYRPGRFDTGRDTGYGLGWGVDAVDGRPVYFHTGGVPGFRAFHLRSPEHDLALLAVATGDTGLAPLGIAVAERLAPGSTPLALAEIDDRAPRLTAQARALAFATEPPGRDALAPELARLPDPLLAQAMPRLPEPDDARALTLVEDTETATARLRRYRLTYPERTVHLQIGHAPDGRIFRIRDV